MSAQSVTTKTKHTESKRDAESEESKQLTHCLLSNRQHHCSTHRNSTADESVLRRSHTHHTNTSQQNWQHGEQGGSPHQHTTIAMAAVVRLRSADCARGPPANGIVELTPHTQTHARTHSRRSRLRFNRPTRGPHNRRTQQKNPAASSAKEGARVASQHTHGLKNAHARNQRSTRVSPTSTTMDGGDVVCVCCVFFLYIHIHVAETFRSRCTIGYLCLQFVLYKDYWLGINNGH